MAQAKQVGTRKHLPGVQISLQGQASNRAGQGYGLEPQAQ